jgi:hypothetical protein
MEPSLQSSKTILDFNLDINTRRKVQAHQHVNRFRIWLENVNQAIMSADFKVLVRVFINKSRATYCKPFYASWQGYWANYSGASSFCGFDDALGRLVQDTVVKCFQADADICLAMMM